MKRSTLLRVLTLALAYAHTFPVRHHLAAFVREPSVAEGWKGFGALIAVGLYLLPTKVQARGLSAVWRRRGLLGAATWLLAAAHAVPLFEHLPRFLESGGWDDAWRGIGAAIAVVWFATPVAQQAAVLGAMCRMAGSRQTPARLSKA